MHHQHTHCQMKSNMTWWCRGCILVVGTICCICLQWMDYCTTDYANNPIYQDMTNEKMYLDLRRSKGYTDELENLPRDDRKLT